MTSAALFFLVLAAVVTLFAAGTRLPAAAVGWRGRATRVAVMLVAAALVLLANVAIFRHDVHFDVTYARAFTPSPEAERVIRALTADVELTYFYQKQNPAGRAAKTMVEIMGRTSPRLRVRTVDPDQQPALANRYGVRVYNVAVLESEGRRLQVLTTEDRDIALGILRVTRAAIKRICFITGHGEYDIDNFEYHTHFEGAHAHSHGAEGMAVVLTEQHGVGRFRRALETLGFEVEKITPATSGRIPDECAAVVDPGPRTRWTPSESDVVAEYLRRGGAALLLLDLDFPVEPRLADVLARAGVRVGDGAVVDPLDHYFTDEQMVAVTSYDPHPITRGVALSFYPGARPLDVLGAPGVTVTSLFRSSAESYLRRTSPAGANVERSSHADVGDSRRARRVLAAASEGTLANGAAPFRLVVIGDADFASNSFFPYMANSDLALATTAWLLREERAPTMKPRVEVLPTVALTFAQARLIFIMTALVMPGVVVVTGGVVWWRRRR